MPTHVPPALENLLPEALARLGELAANLWWIWQPDAQRIFSGLDPAAWVASNHNPVAMLLGAAPARLQAAAADPSYIEALGRVIARLDAYLATLDDSWYARRFPDHHKLIAYFCAEFGLHESLPIYSGGLGVLAGDHLKTASDLGLPLVAIGLWYTQGYFLQHIDSAGQQLANPEPLDRASTPLLPAGADGRELLVEVELPGRTLRARVWRLQVGRVPLYLLDTDVDGNSEADRQLCAHLYGGDREMRIAQEVVLGVGGVRALRALGLSPTTWHMNEGHAAFMGLERIRQMVQSGTPFVDAWPAESRSSVFTTHTPVPAGNEVFREELVAGYLAGFPEAMGIDMPGMLALGHEEAAPDGQFAMTALALRLSHRANGVSALHGSVARKMWNKQFPDLPEDQVPIGSITNGVHSASWIAEPLRDLFDRYLAPEWLARIDDPAIWDGLAHIPDGELWAVHEQLQRFLDPLLDSRLAGTQRGSARLDPQALTIGFARRFASYKRATLFFHDLDRAARILNDPARPVQLVFAGKAHPADMGGQALIRTLVELSERPMFAGKVFFLEGYDMGLARTLVQGCDLWLNNPERPMEASGTSGQKAALNGVPNLSVRDGWWDEGYDGKNGWAFGGEVGHDDVDSADLYRVLEDEVIPAFHARASAGLPIAWIATMKEAIRTCAPLYSAQRMVKEYAERLY